LSTKRGNSAKAEKRVIMGLFGTQEYTGIDIGAGSIKIVRIARGKRPTLLSAAIIERPQDAGPEFPFSALRNMASAKQIGGRNIITMMPGKDITVRTITLPKMPPAELAEAVRWEAKRHISYSLDSAQIEYLIAGERTEGAVEKLDLILVAAETEKVNELLSPLRQAKINVNAVDVNALALRNTLRLREHFLDGAFLVVDIGAGKTEINIYKDATLRFSRCLETGGHDMTKLLADTLGIGNQDAESAKRSVNVLNVSSEDKAASTLRARLDALLMEIRRSIDYYKTSFREKGVQSAMLTGGVSLVNGIAEYCSRALDVPVEIDDPLSALSCTDAITGEFGPFAPRLSAAIGLALRND